MSTISKEILDLVSSVSSTSIAIEENQSINSLKSKFDVIRDNIQKIFGVNISVSSYEACITVKDLINLVAKELHAMPTDYVLHHDNSRQSYQSETKTEEKKSSSFRRDVSKGYTSAGTKQTVDSLQTSKYKTGKNGSTGHGFLAEDYNTMVDQRTGHNVKKVGVSNKKNGADRIVDGKQIQVKYYNTARGTVEAAFDKDGYYKYKYQNGRPQVLEVPSDQYPEAVSRMKVKIQEGKVSGVKNPEHASKMVKKGALTYKQAEDMAKSGKVQGMWHDVQQNAIVIAISGGISAAMAYYQAKKEGKSDIEAAKAAAAEGGKSMVMATGVIVVAQQTTRALTPKVTEETTKAVTRAIVSSTAKEGTKRGVSHAVKGTLSKVASSNAITGAATTVVVSIPDVYHTVKGDISGSECAERVTTNAGSVAGGMAGGIAGGQGGAALGATIGTFICPGAGTAAGAAIGEVIGLITGGVGGSMAGGAATKGVIKTVKGWFRKKK